jgi:hypothetical protein
MAEELPGKNPLSLELKLLSAGQVFPAQNPALIKYC